MALAAEFERRVERWAEVALPALDPEVSALAGRPGILGAMFSELRELVGAPAFALALKVGPAP